jgi:arylsulfatase A-like enzyme
MNTRRDFLRLLSMAAAAAPYRTATAAARPNLVFVLVDDMGWTDTGCYGSTFYQTPNIDRLAATGVRFTSAYAACPVCSPTRASIMSGKYPARLHLTDWIPGENRGEILKPLPFLQELPLEEVTLAEVLHAAGYRTCHVGKWHLGASRYYPEHQGFDINVAGNDWGSPKAGYFSPYKMPNLSEGPAGEHLSERLTTEALKFLDTCGDRPFFLNLWHYAVHQPIQAPEQIVQRYRARLAEMPADSGPEFGVEHDRKNRLRQTRPDYAALVETVDTSVGRVLDKLDQMGVSDRTIVILFSDNGGLSTAGTYPTANRPLRAGKGWLYEGGIREPLIVRWPGHSRAGTTCETPVISTDFYPTMLQMAGLPARPAQHRDGESFAALVEGRSRAPRRNAIFWHYPHYHTSGHRPAGAVRIGDFKLIEFYEDMHVELYDLRHDPSEQEDLSEKFPERAAKLRKMLHDWRKQVRAAMPERK